jgi:hypothetical protein
VPRACGAHAPARRRERLLWAPDEDASQSAAGWTRPAPPRLGVPAAPPGMHRRQRSAAGLVPVPIPRRRHAARSRERASACHNCHVELLPEVLPGWFAAGGAVLPVGVTPLPQRHRLRRGRPSARAPQPQRRHASRDGCCTTRRGMPAPRSTSDARRVRCRRRGGQPAGRRREFRSAGAARGSGLRCRCRRRPVRRRRAGQR